MAHNHAHSESSTSFYVDQLASVTVCGLVAITAILMCSSGSIHNILVGDFTKWVLGGGILLAVLVFFRMVGMALTVGTTTETPSNGNGHNHAPTAAETDCDDCGNGHEHNHDHSHSHGDNGHAHAHAEHSHDHAHSHAGDDQGHSHGGAEWRYSILVIPFLLFYFDLPRKGFSPEYIDRNSPNAIENVTRGKASNDKPIQLKFDELSRAAIFPRQREQFEGKKGILRGQYQKINDKEFKLFKMNVACCVADAVPINARIICSETIMNNWKFGEWVEVTGDIQFAQVKGKANEWVPVLFLDNENQIVKTEAEGF